MRRSMAVATAPARVSTPSLGLEVGEECASGHDLGWTALLEAVILGEGSDRWQRVVRSLLENGADPSIADRDGVTPLQHARNRGFMEIARIIEQFGG